MMKAKPFFFKKFQLQHHRSAHKIGTDGILLATWLKKDGYERILDFGSGCGLMSFILAQRFPEAAVTGLEIDKLSWQESQANLLSNPHFKNIDFIHQDFLKHHSSTGYDLVITNPPYYEEQVRAPDERRSQARQTNSEALCEQIQHAQDLLKPPGVLAMVLDLKTWKQNYPKWTSLGFYPKRICWVRHSEKHPFKRVLVELSQQDEFVQESELNLYQNDSSIRSPAYQGLVQDFLCDQ